MANLTPGNERPDEMELPVELEEMQRRLLRDGAAWRIAVPDNERLNARVRTLPAEMPMTRNRLIAELVEHDAAEGGSSWRDEKQGGGRGEMRQGQERGMQAARTWAGGAAAVAVVAMLAALFVRLASGQAGPGATGVAATPTPAPVTTDTPTVGSKYVTSAVTATGVDAHGNPVNPTSTFQIGETVFVTVTVHNIPSGQHRLTLRWLLNGVTVQLPPKGFTTLPISPNGNDSSCPIPPSAVTNLQISYDGNYSSCLVYPQAGRGALRIYWDAPPSASEAQAEAYLALDVAFVVQDPRASTPSPAATLAPGPTPTPGPTATPGPTFPPGPTPTPPR
jgi:hypothetical protein